MITVAALVRLDSLRTNKRAIKIIMNDKNDVVINIPTGIH